MPVEFKLPELGENIESADVVKVLVGEGDAVESGQTLVELETDKAVIEVPSPESGRIAALHVKPGQRIEVGAPIVTIDGPDGNQEPGPSAEADEPSPVEAPAATETRDAAPAHAEPVVPTPAPAASDASAGLLPAGPATRRLARELGVDLREVAATTAGRRITKEDVQSFIRHRVSCPNPGVMAPVLPDFAKWGPVRREPLARISQTIAENMSVSWSIVPHVTQVDQADVTELEALRRRHAQSAAGSSPKITVTILLLKALAHALREQPKFNSTLDLQAGELILKEHYHVGVAVDTEHGLLVPVVRDVDRKGVGELAAEVAELSAKARERKLTLEQMQGGTFTLSNLGGIGGMFFTPIVYHPQVAVLGVARTKREPVLVDGRLENRLMLPLCLSYDHRVIDGAAGARFTRRLAEILADPLQLM